MKRTLILLFVLLAVQQVVRAENVVNIKYSTTAMALMKTPDTRYIISCVVNLNHKRLTMPAGCTLEFVKGGQIVSGYLTGNGTRIEGETDGIFRYTSISGTFNVPEISTRMFEQVTYDNALKDVMALACADVQNTITIEALPDGAVYNVSTDEGNDIVYVPSNTKVVLHGTVKMAGSTAENYGIFCVYNAENVTFCGDGTIIGDRATHRGTSGEWGMGIAIRGSKNVRVTGLTIRECWGDCIYVGRNNGKECHDVAIDSCLLVGSRRQGISVVACYGAVMKDLEIRDIRGTDPQAAIDVEPNSGDTCSGAWIQRVVVRNCYFGLIGTTPGDAVSKITDIHIEDCDVESEVLGLNAENCNLFEVKNTSVKAEYSTLRSHISTVKIDNCHFSPYEGKELESNIIVLWDVYLDARNSEFCGSKFIDNPKATPASKRMLITDNRINAPVELKMQAGQFIRNTIYGDKVPLVSLILGEGNIIRDNTLIYTGEGRPTNLLDIQTNSNTVQDNSCEYRPAGINSFSPDSSPIWKGGVYDLTGCCLSLSPQKSESGWQLPKGVYIINGRKVVR